MLVIEIPWPKLVELIVDLFGIFTFEIAIPNVARDFIDTSQLKNDKPLTPQFDVIGIDTRFFVLLYSSKLVIWSLTIALFPIFWSLAYLTGLKWFKGAVKSYRYNGIIRMIIELYLEMTLFALINLFSV